MCATASPPCASGWGWAPRSFGKTLAPVTEFKVARVGDAALVTIDNGEDWTKPTFFGEAALGSCDRALDELERGGYRTAVITGKPFFFAAGADITEFPNITPRSEEHTSELQSH